MVDLLCITRLSLGDIPCKTGEGDGFIPSGKLLNGL